MDWITIKPYLYRWGHMMDRCYDPDHPMFPRYGGRGIKVCDEWHNFATYAVQLPAGYFDKAHLDRIDNDGDYEPQNVRWVSALENHNNRADHFRIEYDGRTQNLSQWARELNINIATLHTRLAVWDWPVERAFETPPLDAAQRMLVARTKRYEGHVKKINLTSRTHRKVIYDGRMVTLTELSKICGVSVKLLYKRIFERGWPIEKAVIINKT